MLEETGKIADFFGKTHFEARIKVKSPNLSQWNTSVLSIADHAAGYPKIGW